MLLLALLAACDQPPPSGTSVGNPGKQALRLAEPADLVTLEAAIADELLVDWIGCTGGSVQVLDEAGVDLLGDTVTDVPAGPQCGVVLTFTGAIGLEGTAAEEPFAGEIEPGVVITLWSAGAIDVDEDAFVLELASPGWLDAEQTAELGALVLAERIAADSALFADPDGDGRIDLAERDAGPLASPLLEPPVELGRDDTGAPGRVAVEGCNCATPGPGPGPALWLALLVATARRGSAASRRTARR